MIRVNLLKHVGSGASVSSKADSPSSLTTDTQKQAGFRILTVVGALVAVYIYGVISAGAQRDRLEQVNQQIAKIEAEKTSLGSTAPMVEKYSIEKAKIEKQTTILRKLASDRLLDVKALDALQSLIGSETWLKSVKIEKGQIDIVGYAKNDMGVTELIRTLDSSVFFSGLQVKSSGEEKNGGETVKKFELACSVGRPNE